MYLTDYEVESAQSEAIAELKRAAELDPKASTPDAVLADCYFGQGQYEAAIDEYRKALKGEYSYEMEDAEKSGGELYNAIGMSYAMEKKYPEAIEFLKKRFRGL